MTEDISNLKDRIVKIYQDGGIKSDAAKLISQETGLGATQSKYWAKKIYDEYNMVNGDNFNDESSDDNDDEYVYTKAEEKTLINDLEYSDDYVYNKSDDNYVFLLHKSLGKNVVLSGGVVRALIKTYTNYDGDPATINETALKYKIPRNALIQILRIMGVTHDALPYTPEDIVSRDEEDLVDEYINDKRFTLAQKLQKREWKETKEDAIKWNEFIAGKYDPIRNLLEQWSPPDIRFLPKKTNGDKKSTDNKAFLTVLTDNHIGELTKHSFVGGEYNTDIAVDNVISYLNQIEDKVIDRKSKFEKGVLVCLGDFINSCLDGTTRKGTILDNDIINEEVFDVGMNLLITFIDGFSKLFDKVEIKCTKGNHDSILSYAIYSACEKYFDKNPNVEFQITKRYIDSFRVYNNFFLFSHGATDNIKSALPKNKMKLENFIQSLLLSRAEELVGIKGKYFITGHTHSFEHIEKNEFEFIVCSASVNSDEYAEALGYWSKPRQQSFIVGPDYLEETLHFTL